MFYFNPTMGRLAKQLYSMAGLLLIKEFMDWTKDEVLDAYSFRMDIHSALNLEPVTHDLSMRTPEATTRTIIASSRCLVDDRTGVTQYCLDEPAFMSEHGVTEPT